MKVVIQCCARKNAGAGTFVLDGRCVKFVARPDLNGHADSALLFRPDDIMPSGSGSWREHLIACNRRHGDNTDDLLPAASLYSPPIYRKLLDHCGTEDLFILSAGWGLVRSDFLLPDYDITFSSQAQRWKRRTDVDTFTDFAQLAQPDLEPGESIYFFGGRDYLPLFYRLTTTLAARRVVYFVSHSIPIEQGYEYVRYESAGTNWHYRCADDFIEDKVAK